MLLRFTDRLIVTTKFDAEMAALADRHYSRQTPGSPQFLPPGRTLVIRNSEGTMVFGWVWQFPEYRDDGQLGFNCAIFRNESQQLSSEIILECELLALDTWGPQRMFTYIDPAKIKSRNPGYCFKKAGWRYAGTKTDGKVLLEKFQ